MRLGVASSRIGVRSIELPAIDDEAQFLNAVRFRAQEALPIPLDEAVLDYRVLGEREADGGQMLRRVLLVVAHRELVERYVEACRLAGLTLSGIDLEAFALLRALAPPADRDESAIVAVSIGHDRTTLAVSDGRVCEFSRVLAWGGAELNAGLASALASSEPEVEASSSGSLSLAGGVAPGRSHVGAGGRGGRGAPSRDRVARPRARLVAHVLPVAAGQPRHRRDHPHRRRRQACRPAGGARAAARRSGPRR